MLELCFVMAPRQNEFFFELARTIIDELEAAGHRGSISTDGFPPQREGLVNVLLPPHEYYALEGVRTEPTWDVLKRTIFICAEQPGSSFFDSDLFLAPRAGAVLDINRTSVAAFREAGIEAHHLPLGWTRTWSSGVDFDASPDGGAERDVDVLHLGIYSPKRARALAQGAPFLEPWRCRLLLADDHQSNTGAQANYAAADAKWDLLRRTRVLLNVHVAERAYFEWLRVVQAMCMGAAVVSEHSTDFEPLVPGRHLLSGRVETLGLLAQELLHHEDRRQELAGEAWRFLRHEQPFSRSIERLLEIADGIDRQARVPSGDEPLTRYAQHGASLQELDRLRPAANPPQRFPSDVGDPSESRLRIALKDIRLEQLANRRERRREGLRFALGRAPRQVEHVIDSMGYAGAEPRVSVITALYNQETHIGAALASAAASRDVDLELVVVDDGSTDDSLETVRRWADRHPHVPLRLVRHPVNRGLGHARNTAVDFARADLLFVLDSDNLVYPRGISRLLAAIESDPSAAFSYGLLQEFSPDGPLGLRSAFPWQPWRFRQGNYIDAMALIRRGWLVANGGFATDIRLHGWEDYDLWARVADRGGHGTFTPEIVARYRTSSHSMLTVTDISSVQAVSLLIERNPRVLAGVAPPL